MKDIYLKFCKKTQTSLLKRLTLDKNHFMWYNNFTMKRMKDIAEELGVSIATVSYVYNNRWQEKRINKDIAEKIMKKLKEEDYHPNLISIQLMTQKTSSAGIILGDLSRIFNLNILCGIEKVLSNKGYVSIVASSNLGRKEKEYLKTMQSRKADGIIFSPQTNEKETIIFLKNFCKKTPLVLVDNYIPGLKTSFVVSDNYYGAYQAVKYIIKKGRKKIAYAGANKGLTALKDRFTGYIDALKDAGISPDSSLIYKTVDGLFPPLALKEMFSKAHPDAMFVESLLYFKEGFRLFYEEGIKIPDDVLLTGFDP
ncbi:MAG: LacI family transcriptional regulator, partial [Candidatus Omnitrophica bacterium]|nr:LacI family transcriptional regulator [Candidatus Omnitrophota bacterium]